MTQTLSREVEIDPRHAALLIIDVQNYTARPDGGEYRGLTGQEIEERFGFFFRTFEEAALPNLQRLQADSTQFPARAPSACRGSRRGLPTSIVPAGWARPRYLSQRGSVTGCSRAGRSVCQRRYHHCREVQRRATVR